MIKKQCSYSLSKTKWVHLLKQTKMDESTRIDNITFPSVEEMWCPDCKQVTGHQLHPNKDEELLWTCVHCNHQLK